jgi:tryptophan synthase beta chain
MVRDLQRVISEEIRAQLADRGIGRPTVVVACVGGGSNAIGAFAAFLDDADVQLVGVEAAGAGVDTEQHAATLARGRPGCLHGSVSYLLQDACGQVQPTHSVSAGLDYPGVGPQHSHLKESGRAKYVSVTDSEALSAFQWLARHDGIIPALESAHAVAAALAMRGALPPEAVLVVNLSGRGDKDLDHVGRILRGGQA